MLSQLLIVRLKAAESALKRGRYDEAFRLATEPDIRAHRRGAAVLGELTGRFLERARDHFKADRYAEALLDLTKAEAGGVRGQEIAELREQVRTVAEEELRKENSRRLRVEAARRRIEAGSLRAGQRLLDQASAGDPAAEELRRDLQNKQEIAAERLDEVEQLFGQGRFRDAAELLTRARKIDPRATRVVKLESRICDHLLRGARSSLQAGRVTRAVEELGMLGSLGQDHPERRELEEVIAQVARAGKALAGNRFEVVRQEVLRLAQVFPKGDWVSKVAKQVTQLDELLLALRAGPLGRYAESVQPVGQRLEETVPVAGRGLAETVRLPGGVAGVCGRVAQ